MVYFAGHGCEAMGPDGSTENYLIPVDERGVTDYHLRSTAISVNAVMSAFGYRR